MGISLTNRRPYVTGQRVAYAAPRSKASRTATDTLS